MSVVDLKAYQIEKQYKQSGNQQLDLTQDTEYIHNKKRNLQREYTAAWIKLLTVNIQEDR